LQWVTDQLSDGQVTAQQVVAKIIERYSMDYVEGHAPELLGKASRPEGSGQASHMPMAVTFISPRCPMLTTTARENGNRREHSLSPISPREGPGRGLFYAIDREIVPGTPHA
jgi:hypothetical protein